MSGRSAVYRGEVSHARSGARRRSFSYPVYMLRLDLDDVERPRRAARLFGGTRWFGVERAAPASFRRADFLGDPSRPLSECVRDLVEQRCGERPDGPVELVANPRTLGYQFNPIALYYVYSADGERLTHVVADVTNIPFRESCAYVFAAGDDGAVDGSAQKLMHVSPFLDMDYVYRLRTEAPGDRLRVTVTNSRDGAVEFAAGLKLRRHGASAAALRSTLLRFPAMAALVTARIFWQALRMRLEGYRWHPRAATREPVESVQMESAAQEETRVPVA